MSTPASGDASRTVPRLPLVIALVVLLVVAIVAGNGHASKANTSAVVPRDASVMPRASARSAAWYCPGPPPTKLLASAGENVVASNVGTAPVDVATTVYPDKGKVVRHVVSAKAQALTSLVVDATAAHGAMTAEPFAANVAVEATNLGTGGWFASAPCASQASARWNFAAGTTVRGAEDWIVLFNPFGDDAVVDMSFYTSSGEADPDQLQGMTVPRRSRVAVPVHTYVRREDFVATAIKARTGRIVAQQTVLFHPGSGHAGETRTLGAFAPAGEWVFPSGATASGTTRTIGISNPGDVDAEVDVQVAPLSDIVIEPLTVPVPRHGAVAVQIGGCDRGAPPQCVRVPPRVAYSAVVRATTGVPVVAQDLTSYTSPPVSGAVSTLGGAWPAREWVFPRSHVAQQQSANIDLLSTAGSNVEAAVSFVVNGRRLAPPDLQHIVLKAGVPHGVALGTRPELHNADATVIVRADHPIVAERTLIRADGVSRTIGVAVR